MDNELERMRAAIEGSKLVMPQDKSRRLSDVNGQAQNLMRGERRMNYEDEEDMAPRPARTRGVQRQEVDDDEEEVTYASAKTAQAKRVVRETPQPTVERSAPKQAPDRDPRKSGSSDRPRNISQGSGYKGEVKPKTQSTKQPSEPAKEKSSVLDNLNPKMLIIGGGCVLLIVIAIIVAFAKPKKEPEVVAEQPVVETPVQEPVTMGWWESDPNWSGFLDEYGNPIMNDPNGDFEFEMEDGAFEYTEEQLMALREAGFTGREIEKYEAEEADADLLIKEAVQAQRDWAKKINDSILDKTWSGFTETWLGLDERIDVTDFNEYIMVHQETKNLDYEKIPVRGNQIFIKVYLDDLYHEDYFFMQVEPNEYSALNSEGNILVTYNYIHPTIIDADGFEVEDESRMFIVDAYQVTITN